MARSKLVFVMSMILINIAVAVISFEMGGRMTSTEQDKSGVYYTQAVLAFGHYTSYERIKVLLERKCYEAALTDVREMQNLQVILLSDNLKRAKGDPSLLEYIEFRNPELLRRVLAGDIPESGPYTTTCTWQEEN